MGEGGRGGGGGGRGNGEGEGGRDASGRIRTNSTFPFYTLRTIDEEVEKITQARSSLNFGQNISRVHRVAQSEFMIIFHDR